MDNQKKVLIDMATLDSLADTIWWLKGFKSGIDKNGDSAPDISYGHIQALVDIRSMLLPFADKEAIISTRINKDDDKFSWRTLPLGIKKVICQFILKEPVLFDNQVPINIWDHDKVISEPESYLCEFLKTRDKPMTITEWLENTILPAQPMKNCR